MKICFYIYFDFLILLCIGKCIEMCGPHLTRNVLSKTSCTHKNVFNNRQDFLWPFLSYVSKAVSFPTIEIDAWNQWIGKHSNYSVHCIRIGFSDHFTYFFHCLFLVWWGTSKLVRWPTSTGYHVSKHSFHAWRYKYVGRFQSAATPIECFQKEQEKATTIDGARRFL